MYAREIYVSGFGPFRGHEDCNASIEAVKLLPDSIDLNAVKFKINKSEVQVVYEEVDDFVKQIWSKNPLLVVHCGVYSKIDKLHLEKCSFSNGYCGEDFTKKCLPQTDVCLRNNTCSMLESKLPIDKIVAELNSEYKNIFAASCDVGRYLCGYIYLKSLDEDNSRSLFIHVPPIDKMSSEEAAAGILKIVEKCLQELFNQNKI